MKIARLDWKRLLPGLALIALGVALPLLLTVESFGVNGALYEGLRRQNEVKILEAALRLALLNALRCYPHYLGAFFIAEAFEITRGGRRQRWINVAVLVVLISSVYLLIDVLYRVHYDFGVPAVVLVSLQLLFWMVDYSYIKTLKKVSMMLMFLTAMQFLDLMPALARLPFGRGESSQNIKLAARIMGMGSALNQLMLLMFLLFFGLGVLLFLLLRDENRFMELSELREQNERMRAETRMAELENRTTQELQHLVHDLKTPLTSIQTLAWVVKSGCGGPEQGETREYLERIENSVDHMSDMISEILYEEHKAPVTVEALLRSALAQLSVTSYAEDIRLDDRVPDAVLYLNSIRMARAIINLIENAWHARSERAFSVLLTADRAEDGGTPAIRLTVEDNGVGMAPDKLERVWERGFSERGSSGLGLSYVRSVVEQSGGRIFLESVPDQGTTVTILLPEGEEEHEWERDDNFVH